MLLPSQIKYDEQVRHFVCVYFDTGSLEEMVKHGGEGEDFNCNTCNMFYNVIQSIQGNVISEYGEEDDFEMLIRLLNNTNNES